MSKTNESKLKGFLTRLFKKIELGKPFKICFQGESTYINEEQINSAKEKSGGFLLPLTGKVLSFIKGGNGFETKEGGILPLAALLPLIFGGIAAAGGTAGGIASAVKAANDKAKNDLELEEQRRHNKVVEESIKGNGIFLNPYKGKALKEILIPVIDKIDGVEQEGKKQIKNVIKSLTPFFKIHEVKDGSGIYLEPR